jgi:hypothetical protein
MGVGAVTLGHLLDRVGEAPLTVKDVGVLGEETEDQSGEKVVEVLSPGGGVPIGIGFQQLDVEAVESAGGADVEGVFTDLLDGGDPRQWQEETEMQGSAAARPG